MELILELSRAQLDVLRKTFLQNDGLTLTEFVAAMLELLPPRYQEDVIATTRQLEDAFQQIDVNGDQNLEWDELMGALLDAGGALAGGVGRRAPFHWLEVDEAARATPHSTRLTRVRALPELSAVVVCEAGRRGFLLYNTLGDATTPELGLHPLGAVSTAVPGVTDGGEVFDVCYDAASQILVCTVGDFSLQFYDMRPLAGRELEQNEPLAARRRQREQQQRDADDGGGGCGGGAAAAATPGDGTVLGAALGAIKAAAGIRSSRAHNGGSDGSDSPAVTASAPAATLPPPYTGVSCGSSSSSRAPRYITRVHTHTPQRGVLLVPGAGRLLTYGVGSEVHVWGVTLRRCGAGFTDFEVKCGHKASLTGGHDDQVTDLVLLGGAGLVATASLDGSVCLWAVKGAPNGAGGRRGHLDDTSPQQHAMAASHGGIYLHTKHTGVHGRGVRCLLYLPSLRVLLSAGFEGCIVPFDMGSIEDGRAGLPGPRLEGHASAVVAMTSLEPHDLVPSHHHGGSVSGGGGGDGGTAAAATAASKQRLAASGSSEAALQAFAELRRRVPHYGQFVSVDDRGGLRWWDLAEGDTDSDRCLQAWQPHSVALSGQPYDARGLVTLRTPHRPAGGRGGGGGGGDGGGGADSRGDSRASDDSAGGDGGAAGDGGGGGRRGGAYDGAVLLAVGPRLKVFHAVRSEDDTVIAAGGVYQDLTLSFLAVSRGDVRAYSVETGAVTRSHRGCIPGDASPGCVTFDGRRRKLLVGCTNGTTAVLNAFTGKLLKALPAHDKDVTGLAYVPPDNTVITTSADGCLHVSDELVEGADGDSGSTALLRRVRAAHGAGVPIAAVAFDYSLSCIATGAARAPAGSSSGSGSGGSDALLRLWDYCDFSLVGTLRGQHAAAGIAALAFLPPYAALASADTAGVVCIWHVPRGTGKPTGCLATFVYGAAAAAVERPLTPPGASASPQPLPLPVGAQADLSRLVRRLGVSHASSDSDMLRAHSAFTSAQAVDGVLEGAREAVTCMACVPAVSACGDRADDDGSGSNQDDGSSEGGGRRQVFPSLALGDDAGRVMIYPLQAVFDAQYLQLATAAVAPAGSGCAAAVAAPLPTVFSVSDDQLSTQRRAAAATRSGASVSLLRLRARVEPFDASKAPASMSTYNPRKTCKLSGATAAAARGQQQGGVGGGGDDASSCSSVSDAAADAAGPHAGAATHRPRVAGMQLLPVLVGHQLSPSAVVARAHGAWRLLLPPGAASGVPRTWQWVPSPVRSLTAVDSRELCCVVSTGDDGCMSVLTWDGDVLGSLNVAKGRVKLLPPPSPQPVEAETDAAGSGGNSDGAAAAQPASDASSSSSPPPDGSQAGVPDAVSRPSRVADGITAAAAAPPGPPLEEPWCVPVDRESRERYLTASACGTLAEIALARERAERVEAAVAAGEAGGLDYDDVKEYERHRRRTSVVAAAEYCEGVDKLAATTATVMGAARRHSVAAGLVCPAAVPPADVTAAPPSSSSAPAPVSERPPTPPPDALPPTALATRYRAIGQLFNQKTYDESATDRALAAACEHAQAVMAATTPDDFLLPPSRRPSLAVPTASFVLGRTDYVASAASTGDAARPATAPMAPPEDATGGAVSTGGGGDDSSSCSGGGEHAHLQELAADDKAEWARLQLHRRGRLMVLPSASAAAAAEGEAAVSGPGVGGAGGEDGSDSDGGNGGDGSGDGGGPFRGLSLLARRAREKELREKGRQLARDSGEIPTIHLPNGDVVDDPVRIQRHEAATEWERTQYPHLVRERRRSLTETADGRAQARLAAAAAASAAELSPSSDDDSGGAGAVRRLALAGGGAARRRQSLDGATSAVSTRRPLLSSPTAAAADTTSLRPRRGSHTSSIAQAPSTPPLPSPPQAAPAAKAVRSHKVAAHLFKLQGVIDAGGDIHADDDDAADPPVAPAAPPARRDVGGVARALQALPVDERVEALVQRYHGEPDDGGDDGLPWAARRRYGSGGSGSGRRRNPELRSLDVEGLLKPKFRVFQPPPGSAAAEAAASEMRTATRLATAAALSRMTTTATAPAPAASAASSKRGYGLDRAPPAERRYHYCPVAEDEPAGGMAATASVALAAVHWKRQALLAPESASCAGASVAPQPSEDDATPRPAATPPPPQQPPPHSSGSGSGGSAGGATSSSTATSAAAKAAPQPSTSNAATRPPSRHVLSNFTWHRKLAPPEYVALARRRKIGGEPRRDVLTFRDMCDRVDRDGSGDISFDEFVLELESNRSGVKHMRRTLEGMFRAADVDGSGSLSLHEFGQVMFPRASPGQLSEILAFVTYDGPAPASLLPVVRKGPSPEALAQLRALFDAYDADGSGAIDADELANALGDVFRALFPCDDASLSPAAVARQKEREGAFLGEVTSGLGPDAEEIGFDDFVKVLGPYFVE